MSHSFSNTSFLLSRFCFPDFAVLHTYSLKVQTVILCSSTIHLQYVPKIDARDILKQVISDI